MIFQFNINNPEIEYFKKIISNSELNKNNRYYFKSYIGSRNRRSYYNLILIKKKELWKVHYFNPKKHYEFKKNFTTKDIMNLLKEIWADRFRNNAKGDWLNRYDLIKHSDTRIYYYKNCPFNSNSTMYDFFNKAGYSELSITIDESGANLNKNRLPDNINNIKNKKAKIVLTNLKNRI